MYACLYIVVILV